MLAPSPIVDNRPFAQTHSGRRFPLINPSPDDVHWEDVAWALAHSNRYAGNAGVYSVAQHSILVAYALPAEHELHGLLHDAHEFVIGDMTRPTKMALCYFGFGNSVMCAFERLRDGVDRAIFRAADCPWPSAEAKAIVKHADLRVTMTEKRDLLAPMQATDAEWLHSQPLAEPLPAKINPWPPEAAFEAFMRELKRHAVI